MLRSEERMDKTCLTLFLVFLLMMLDSLVEWAALIHFNLIDLGWPYWRGGVIGAVMYALVVYMRAKEGDVTLLFASLISMAAPWVLGAIIVAGYLLISWHIPDFKYLSFSQFGLFQLTCNVLVAILAVKSWLFD